MLQQTTVAAVIAYYQRFLERFPSVEQLAAAPLEEVIDLWAGLGYYSRARNLHAAARQIVEEFAGCFPRTPEELEHLPGIGRSTAGAIAALAFDRRAPILDGNVRRVLCRLLALQEPSRTAGAEKRLWQWSEALTPAVNVHDYTQAIMDLGATVCLPRRPLCEECPLAEICQARRLGLELQLPMSQPGKDLPTRHEAVLLIEHAGSYLVRRRPLQGFLGGLWEFPTQSLTEAEDAVAKLRLLVADFGLQGRLELLGYSQHTYSHFRLNSVVYRIRTANSSRIAEGDHRWYPSRQLTELALHGAHKKALGILLNNGA